jgi:activator of HSP90 ATPase
MSMIHQEVEFKAAPESLYDALTDAKKFSAATGGAPTEIAKTAGGEFSCFGGYVTGRQVELVPGVRVVQAWRAKTWEEGLYSIARFELKKSGSGTQLVFDHAGFPEDQKDHLADGWKSNYWDTLKKFLAE